MRVALITALPPSGGAGAARVRRDAPTPTRRKGGTLKIRVAPAEVDAAFAAAPDLARGLPYSPPIVNRRLVR